MMLLEMLILIPLLSSLALLAAAPLAAKWLRVLAVFLSAIPLALLLIAYPDPIGSTIRYDWIPALSIHLHFAIDALSLVFLLLTAFIVPIALLVVPIETLTSPHLLFCLVLMLEGLMIGFFTARDLVVFTLFWEAMLLPLYFILVVWGGPQRYQAAIKFLLYMIAGSTLMIAGLLALYVASPEPRTFDIDALTKTASSVPYATWIAAVFLLAFAVKTPLFPFHAWLPEAYTQAPVVGTVLLSALLSKAGIYGISRLGLTLFSPTLAAWSYPLTLMAIVGVFYGALAAWSEQDYKKLLAYSSLSHVNFILVGLFANHDPSQMGAILQAVNHGITITALFLVAWWLECRIGSTSMERSHGLAASLPRLCWLTLFFVLSSMALPGLNNFIGEVLILLGLFKKSAVLAAMLVLSVILSAVYMLRWMQITYFGPSDLHLKSLADIGPREFAITLPLVVAILWLGLYPGPVIRLLQGVL